MARKFQYDCSYIRHGLCEAGSCDSIVTRLRNESPKKCFSILGEAKTCLFSIASNLSAFSSHPCSNKMSVVRRRPVTCIYCRRVRTSTDISFQVTFINQLMHYIITVVDVKIYVIQKSKRHTLEILQHVSDHK
jgi:hypothetical protein